MPHVSSHVDIFVHDPDARGTQGTQENGPCASGIGQHKPLCPLLQLKSTSIGYLARSNHGLTLTNCTFAHLEDVTYHMLPQESHLKLADVMALQKSKNSASMKIQRNEIAALLLAGKTDAAQIKVSL